MEHCDELARRGGQHGVSMADDRDRPPHFPAGKPNDHKSAGSEVTLDGELAAARHAVTASYRQLHRFPVR
jgi:hypothetical protein